MKAFWSLYILFETFSNALLSAFSPPAKLKFTNFKPSTAERIISPSYFLATPSVKRVEPSDAINEKGQSDKSVLVGLATTRTSKPVFPSAVAKGMSSSFLYETPVSSSLKSLLATAYCTEVYSS